jgi:SEC-C motif
MLREGLAADEPRNRDAAGAILGAVSRSDMGTKKTGRNDRCPCGSGKKFKKCCLVTSAAFTRQDRASALVKLEEFIDDAFSEESDRALAEFWGDYLDHDGELDDNRGIVSTEVFEMWLTFDRKLSDGSRLIDKFLGHQREALTNAEREYLETVRRTSMRLYEVADLAPGMTVTLRDVLDGRQLTVHERSGSRNMGRFEWYAARISPRGASGKPEIEAGLLHIPRLLHEHVRSNLICIRDKYFGHQPHATSDDFFKEMPPFFHRAWIEAVFNPPVPQLKNTNGEDLLITRVCFDLLDGSGLQEALAADQFIEKINESTWQWCGKNNKGKEILLGQIELKEGRLILEANSRERGDQGRSMLESIAGNRIRHRMTTHEDMTRTVRDEIRSGRLDKDPRVPPDTPPPEVNEALVLDHLSKHYREWLDEEIPALDDHTPREAAKDKRLREKLIDLIRDLEGTYQQALKRGDPAYDPSWMWDELGMREPPARYPPPLAHERVKELVPGAAEVCRAVVEQVRRQPDFSKESGLIDEATLNASLDFQRFVRKYQSASHGKDAPSGLDCDQLKLHLRCITNFELHRRKTFWVDESLAYMLAQTEADVVGRDLRVPFVTFALVFTDRYTFSLAERLLSSERSSPLAGHLLKIATVYVTEEVATTGRVLKLAFALDALGADPPALVSREIALDEEGPVEAAIDRVALQAPVDMRLAIPSPLRGLIQITLNAILYATSAGVEPEIRRMIGNNRSRARGHDLPECKLRSEVYFLPGTIDISRVRRLQELERTSNGRPMLNRFMVRGHWRRPSTTWKDQRMRWIEPYWKGPDIAAVIERAYRLKP